MTRPWCVWPLPKAYIADHFVRRSLGYCILAFLALALHDLLYDLSPGTGFLSDVRLWDPGLNNRDCEVRSRPSFPTHWASSKMEDFHGS